MIRACIIGWPVDHSRSPMIHGYWLKTYRIDGSYVKQAVRPGEVPAFLHSLRNQGLAGCNVTIPHKEAAYAAAGVTMPAARAVAAANTLWFEGDQLVADNTDAAGFMSYLRACVPGFDARRSAIAVLGAGGAARGIIYAFLDAGAPEVRIFNRTRERADAVARHFGPRVKPHDWRDRVDHSREASVLVNATSLGMQHTAPLDMPLAQLDGTCIVADLVYVPLVTPLLTAARERGLTTVDGLGMLLLVGLTGSIGMGKSTVAARLRALGIAVCDADAEVHKLYEGAAVPAVEAAFPGTTADGKVDRQKLAAALLAEPDKFKRLEAIVHPLVFAAERAFLHGEAAKAAAMAVIEVPLLLETGGEKRVDAVIVVSAPAEAQRQRVMQRSGMTLEKLEQMRARQMSDADKRARADFVVDTGGTFDDTHAQVDRVVESLKRRQGTAFAKFWA
jgi:shikimate dehydrogenase